MLADSPGTIALPTHEMGRFLLFTISLSGTNQPPGCFLNASASASVTENLNKIMGDIRDEDAWVWIMGDDHCWNNSALVDMLRTMDRHPEIDVLVPLVTKRNPPWHPGRVRRGRRSTPTTAHRCSGRSRGSASRRAACSRSTPPAQPGC